MEILYHSRVQNFCHYSILDGKVLRIENAIDRVKIEHRCITECYVSKASFA